MRLTKYICVKASAMQVAGATWKSGAGTTTVVIAAPQMAAAPMVRFASPQWTEWDSVWYRDVSRTLIALQIKIASIAFMALMAVRLSLLEAIATPAVTEDRLRTRWVTTSVRQYRKFKSMFAPCGIPSEHQNVSGRFQMWMALESEIAGLPAKSSWWILSRVGVSVGSRVEQLVFRLRSCGLRSLCRVSLVGTRPRCARGSFASASPILPRPRIVTFCTSIKRRPANALRNLQPRRSPPFRDE